MLVVIETHPIQYHAPVYRCLQEKLNIPVTVIYGSDFSLAGYHDKEFDSTFAWDTDLLSGYRSIFLSKVSKGGAKNADEVSAKGLGDVLEAIKPKAVLLTGYNSRFHLAAFYQAKRRNLPIIFRGDTADHAVHRGPIKGWVRDVVLRWFYGSCEKLLYIGKHYSYEHFKRLKVPDHKLIFSPYCIDERSFKASENFRDIYRPLVRDQLNLREDQIMLLFSGKLIGRKNPEIIPTAIGHLSAEIQKKMVIAFMGNGEMKSSIETAGKKSLAQIIFLGFKNQTELSPYYFAADLFVFPARSEVWGLVVNEALSHGLPCVLSKTVGAAPDLIDEGLTGELCDPDSAVSLANAISRGLGLTRCYDVRKKCREKVADYSVEKAAEGMAKAYRELPGAALV